MGRKLRRVVDIGRRQEAEGDGGSLLLRVYRASTDKQETLGATGSNMKQHEAAAVCSPTTNLRSHGTPSATQRCSVAMWHSVRFNPARAVYTRHTLRHPVHRRQRQCVATVRRVRPIVCCACYEALLSLDGAPRVAAPPAGKIVAALVSACRQKSRRTLSSWSPLVV